MCSLFQIVPAYGSSHVDLHWRQTQKYSDRISQMKFAQQNRCNSKKCRLTSPSTTLVLECSVEGLWMISRSPGCSLRLRWKAGSLAMAATVLQGGWVGGQVRGRAEQQARCDRPEKKL